VCAAYRDSFAVLTNRLHSAIFGMLLGAAPLTLDPDPASKVARTLATVGLTDLTWPEELTSQIEDLAVARGCAERVARARRDLEAVRARIDEAIVSEEAR
jgi:hypothetical protein